MVRTSLSGGIRATGSAMARFFHPSKKIREKWPHDKKRRLTGVLVIGEAKQHVNRKEHQCYLVRIPEINDGTTFYVVKKNFKVEVAPPEVFESKRAAPINLPTPAAPAAHAAECASDRNAVSNVEGTGMDMEDLARNPAEAGAAPPEGT